MGISVSTHFAWSVVMEHIDLKELLEHSQLNPQCLVIRKQMKLEKKEKRLIP